MRIFRRKWRVRGKKEGKPATRESRNYYGEYKDGSGRTRRVRLCADKSVSERMLAKISSDAALEAVGVRNPFRKQEKMPLSEHLADFARHLKAQGRTAKHIKHTMGMCQCIVQDLKFQHISDLSASRTENFLARLHGKGLSASTINHYIVAIKSFAAWLVRDERTASNPLVGLRRLNPNTDKRRIRRALTDGEKKVLIEASEKGPVFKGLSGPHRALCYKVALTTGLRAAELRSLTWASFDLDSLTPTVVVEAAYSKHRRRDTLPLKESVAAELRKWKKEQSHVERVFPLPVNTVEMLRQDFDTANIPYRDEAGRVADFHALRHTFITDLVRAGAHPKVAQTLARHSSITLTMDAYCHFEAKKQRGVVEALPDLTKEAAKSEPQPPNFVPYFVRILGQEPAEPGTSRQEQRSGAKTTNGSGTLYFAGFCNASQELTPKIKRLEGEDSNL